MTDRAPANLARYTTLRLGGPAAQITAAHDRAEVAAALDACDAAGTPVLVLAGGSNVVIGDDGFDGHVVLVRSVGIEASAQGDDEVLVTAEAGHDWDDVVRFTVDTGLAGVEFLSGVPGSAGATPIQNVGAYGQEVAETIATVCAYDRRRRAVVDLTAAECGFGYRTSVFKGCDRYAVLAVTFRLRRSPLSTPIRYAEAARTLGVSPGDRVPLAAARDAVRVLRAGKGMVLDPADPDTRSVGSFFTNPVIDAEAFSELQARAVARSAGEPAHWAVAPRRGEDGDVKVSAAWLIEHAGFGKGYAGDHNGVGVSTKHTLALTNRGSGTTTALLALAGEIRAGVRDAFGVDLHPEPVLVGCVWPAAADRPE